MIVWVYTGLASRCITLADAYHLVKQYSPRGGALDCHMAERQQVQYKL